MIDLVLLRDNPKKIIALLKTKDPSYDGQQLFELDQKVRMLRADIDSLRHEKNDLARQAQGGITPEIREKSIAVGKELKQKEEQFQQVECDFKQLYLSSPNVPEEDIPVGSKDKNEVVKKFGEKKNFSFDIKNHLDLGTALGWLDFENAARMTGSQFALYRGDAVKLLYSLTMFMLKHNMKYGYEPILPPYLVNARSLEVASNFPKFKDQVYSVPEDELYLTPTSEVNLTNLYRDAILSGEQLPIRMTAWTSCFRREAGGYGATERGLIRVHQFEKVELYTICRPQNSDAEQQRMLECVELLLQQLDLHYRVSLLATQDCSFPSARTYDVEVWLPGQGEYYEVSSISKCTDFQARRGKIRYKEHAGDKTELVNTLNGSSLALSRLMVAIMEVYQKEDGTIEIPEVLKKCSLFE